jgi:hypothetical protein
VIIFEFSDYIVESGKLTGPICRLNDGAVRRISRHTYMMFAEKAYFLDGTHATMVKDRSGELKDFELSGEDAVALVLKAVVL